MNYLKVIICMIAAVFVVSWTGSSRAEEIVLGYTGPLSGPAAEYGQDIFNGIEMAVKEIINAVIIILHAKNYTFIL